MDPYKVLGVSPNASDEEIKASYRALAKKYHPDAYANNPLADLAAEKMKEINMAYDQIMKMRKEGGSSGYSGGYNDYSGSGSYSYGGYTNSSFPNIRELINAGKLAEAEAALNAVPPASRNAEWHFLRGCVLYKFGWVNEAYLEFQNAVQMDGGNGEYREAYERIRQQMNGGYRTNPYGGYGTGGMQNSGCTACDLCAGLACADCLCNGGC